MQYTDVAACLHETGLDTGVDRRTTIAQIENEWLLVEYDEQLSSLANVSGFVAGLKAPTDIITIAHVGHMSPREVGFEVISSPQYPNNPEESASSSAPGPRPRFNDPALQQPQLDAAPSDAPVVPVEPVEQRAVEGARDDMEVEAADPGEHQVEYKGRVLSESDTLAKVARFGGESACGAKGEWGRVSFGVVCDVVVFFFCGEWRRVSFRGCEGGNGDESALELRVLSSSSFAGNGGESASGGVKGEWGRVSFWSCVCCSQLWGWVCCRLLLLRGMEASQLPGVRRGNDVSQLWGWV